MLPGFPPFAVWPHVDLAVPVVGLCCRILISDRSFALPREFIKSIRVIANHDRKVVCLMRGPLLDGRDDVIGSLGNR